MISPCSFLDPSIDRDFPEPEDLLFQYIYIYINFYPKANILTLNP